MSGLLVTADEEQQIVLSLEQNDMVARANEAQALYEVEKRKAQLAMIDAANHVIDLGNALATLKADLPHGLWGRLFANHPDGKLKHVFQFSQQWGLMAMRFAKDMGGEYVTSLNLPGHVKSVHQLMVWTGAREDAHSTDKRDRLTNEELEERMKQLDAEFFLNVSRERQHFTAKLAKFKEHHGDPRTWTPESREFFVMELKPLVSLYEEILHADGLTY